MRKLLSLISVFLFTLNISAADMTEDERMALAEQNLERSMALVDGVMDKCFTGTSIKTMKDVYDFSTHKCENGTSDVWPFTAVIESVNSILEGLEAVKAKNPTIYNDNHDRYVELLNNLYKYIKYYTGSFELTSYTRTTQWKGIYAVHRGYYPGFANVKGIENVYDDQMWIVREYIRAYKNTGKADFLEEAEHLTEYILDGWDPCLDSRGNEYGGITWGPGYTSKHACSNSPFISPLVWLAEIYKGKDDMTTHYFINKDQSRGTRQVKKYDYYLDFAKRIYAWQKTNLFDKNTGCYHDMRGGLEDVSYEEIDGVKYRKHVGLGGAGGTQFTYNTGTMLSGAIDLYLATGDEYYLTETKDLAKKSYMHFRGSVVTKGRDKYFPFPYDTDALNGFNAWFNDVLLRAFVDAEPYTDTVNAFGKDANYARTGCTNFQQNLDYAYANYLQDGFLPNNLLGGWESNTKTKAFHQVSYASEYAKLVQYLVKGGTTGIVNFNTETVGKNTNVDVYTIDGRRIRSNVSGKAVFGGLKSGIYIVNGRKYMVK